LSRVISGVVRALDGSPIAQARVYYSSAPTTTPDIAALTNDHGEFALSAPAPGEYVIEVAAEGFSPGGIVVDVTERADVEAEIRLSPG
jgi:Carboxypeptidase regulatory-like domain